MTKKAVLIGVNRYRIPGNDLRGCVPDVKNMANLLQRQYEFESGDISLITDFDATKEAIESAITGLVREARRGDVLLLHYSGHGSNVPDDNGDEDDNRDEILCPTDLDWNDPLRDDWLRNVFDGLSAGVSLTVISDCCHSGTITRALEQDGPAGEHEVAQLLTSFEEVVQLAVPSLGNLESVCTHLDVTSRLLKKIEPNGTSNKLTVAHLEELRRRIGGDQRNGQQSLELPGSTHQNNGSSPKPAAGQPKPPSRRPGSVGILG